MLSFPHISITNAENSYDKIKDVLNQQIWNCSSSCNLLLETKFRGTDAVRFGDSSISELLSLNWKCF